KILYNLYHELNHFNLLVVDMQTPPNPA
mgnify:CR=1